MKQKTISAMETETPTPTITPTPTATLNYYVELTTPGGEDARMVREAYVDELMTVALLIALIISIWLMYVVNRLEGGNV